MGFSLFFAPQHLLVHVELSRVFGSSESIKTQGSVIQVWGEIFTLNGSVEVLGIGGYVGALVNFPTK